jgi:hypothetical protein
LFPLTIELELAVHFVRAYFGMVTRTDLPAAHNGPINIFIADLDESETPSPLMTLHQTAAHQFQDAESGVMPDDAQQSDTAVELIPTRVQEQSVANPADIQEARTSEANFITADDAVTTALQQVQSQRMIDPTDRFPVNAPLFSVPDTAADAFLNQAEYIPAFEQNSMHR